jgi:hypothetical protein
MRDMGVRGVLIYCADFQCSHSVAMNTDHWPDDVRLSDIEPRFVCAACGKRHADLRPILEAMRDRPLRAIAEELTNRNIPTPRGGDVWGQVTVMRVMKRLGIAGE